jgi:hypothetical protein
MPFDAADNAAFNDPDMPAYALATIGAASVAGRFHARYGEALGIAGGQPMFGAATTSLSGVSAGSSVIVGGVTYTVTAVQNDNIGQTTLMMQEA